MPTHGRGIPDQGRHPTRTHYLQSGLLRCHHDRRPQWAATQEQSCGACPIEAGPTLPHISLATITILANDVQWSLWVQQCINPTINCATDANTAAFRLLLAKGGAGLAKSLRSMVFGLRIDHTALTGYYDPMGSRAGSDFGLLPDEIAWYRARLDDLNTTLRAEARIFPRVTYVPISLDAAADDVIRGGEGIFHPTEQGQTKIADAVLADCRQHSCTG